VNDVWGLLDGPGWGSICRKPRAPRAPRGPSGPGLVLRPGRLIPAMGPTAAFPRPWPWRSRTANRTRIFPSTQQRCATASTSWPTTSAANRRTRAVPARAAVAAGAAATGLAATDVAATCAARDIAVVHRAVSRCRAVAAPIRAGSNVAARPAARPANNAATTLTDASCCPTPAAERRPATTSTTAAGRIVARPCRPARLQAAANRPRKASRRWFPAIAKTAAARREERVVEPRSAASKKPFVVPVSVVWRAKFAATGHAV